MQCPVCNSNSDVFMKGIFDCETTLVRECNNCKLHFLDPKMTIEEEENYYKNYYDNQKIRQQKEYTMHNIQNNALSHYTDYYDSYHSLIENAENILEVGSGSGGFLKFIIKTTQKKNIYSIEKSESNIKFLKKEFQNVNFIDSLSDVNNIKFDLIVAFGVFEHIRNLNSFISELKLLLKDNSSKIVFTVPNVKDVLISFFNLEEYKKFIYMKQHYYVFSKESFYHIAENNNLLVDSIDFIQVWGIDNHLSWLNDRKPQDFHEYTNFISNKLNIEYKKNLISKEMTDLILVCFKRSFK